MKFNQHGTFLYLLSTCLLAIFYFGCSSKDHYPILDHSTLAHEYFQEDSQWYLDNIPFFECSDKQIEQVYYYRWKLYKAHIRNVGDNRFVITEFINHMGFDRGPYCTINAASMHHIYEGRWLKDNRYLDGYINYLYQDGGNNRQYSESIADAAYARWLVNADTSFLLNQLDSMEGKYSQWQDHWDGGKNLYYIPAMPDATEYTIASIDASGGKGGFDGGDAFRPTINSYMYGNAMAISHIAAMKGDSSASRYYLEKALALKGNIEHYLWNDSLQHFTDRHQITNQYVKYWDFIRGRELAGFAPWYFNLPTDNGMYSAAWKHVTDTSQLLGRFGFRTNEPSYEYYFKQFVYNFGQPSSQWNGPSWPYQTSQVMTGMANLLNNYKQGIITSSDYVKLLRLFAQQHFLPDGKIDIVENYDPNKGGPIVFYYWSNHYNHSTFNNLIITGLCGIRPSEGDTLAINPLVDSSIRYFCLDDVLYHGHKLTVIYDRDGSHYKYGKGVTVFVDGKITGLLQKQNKYEVVVGPPIITRTAKLPVNYALNINHQGYPLPSASVNTVPDSSIYQAIDGRIWYFPDITNRWTTLGSSSTIDWYALDFGQARQISTLKIYPFADSQTYALPDTFTVEYNKGDHWLPVKIKEQLPVKPVGNTGNTLIFDNVTTSRVRVNFKHTRKAVAISEFEFY